MKKNACAYLCPILIKNRDLFCSCVAGYHSMHYKDCFKQSGLISIALVHSFARQTLVLRAKVQYCLFAPHRRACVDQQHYQTLQRLTLPCHSSVISYTVATWWNMSGCFIFLRCPDSSLPAFATPGLTYGGYKVRGRCKYVFNSYRTHLKCFT